MKFRRNMFAWCSLFLSYPLAAQSVNVAVAPAQPAMERSRCCILLNFDFEVNAPDTLTLEWIGNVPGNQGIRTEDQIGFQLRKGGGG